MAKVKICGITNMEDALLCEEVGADALGFNFYPKSPRYINPENARVIVEALAGSVLTIGVFVDAKLDEIADIARTAGLGSVQLHGNETREFARQVRDDLNIPVIKAFRVSTDFKPEDVLQFDVDAILLDAYSPYLHGGTGETFDWEIARKVREIFPKMYLAGGLSPANVHSAIREITPYAVDACSSLEISPGNKDTEKVRLFIEEARRND